MTPSAKAAGGRRRRTRWTRETVIEKILEWHALYGEPPTAADWNPSLARWRAQEWRIERYRAGEWPAVNAAKRPFEGSFSAAVRAAGLEPHGPGPRRGAGASGRRPGVAPAGDGGGRAIAEADARVRAALDQADAARRDADHAHEQARAALAEVERLHTNGTHPEANGTGPDGRLTAARLAALRGDGPSGPAVLAAALRGLVRARAGGDRRALAHALAEVAEAAVRWRDRL
jgi:hypothetical protein